MRLVFGRRLVVAALVTAVAVLLFQVSYFQDNAEAYLFPSVVAGAMLVFSLISFSREAFDLCMDDYQRFPFARQVPVILVMFAGVFLLETLGMYTTSFLILMVVSYWYSPPGPRGKRLLVSLALAFGFSALMYALFSVLLKVQVPRGWLL
jgi:hypothetical protein